MFETSFQQVPSTQVEPRRGEDHLRQGQTCVIPFRSDFFFIIWYATQQR